MKRHYLHLTVLSDTNNGYLRHYYINQGNSQDTGISVNGMRGKTILVIASCNTGDADNTAMKIVAVRCGYSGNHIEENLIVRSGTTMAAIDITQINGYLYLVANQGDAAVTIITTSLL